MSLLIIAIIILVVATFFATYLAEAYTTDIRVGTFAKCTSILFITVGLVLLFIAAGWKILLAGLGGVFIGLIVFGQWWSKRPLVYRHPPVLRESARLELIESTEQAIQVYDEAIRLTPEDADIYYNRGLAYGLLGHYERAIDDYDEVIRLNPEHADAYYARAVIWNELGQTQKAIDDYDKAIRCTQYPKAYYNRGLLYRKLGRSLEAKRDIAKAKELGFPP
jgi:tetratricopeptide (TPR) repeat protein